MSAVRRPEGEQPPGPRHVPGSPCTYCEKPTPMDGTPCPDCWTSLTDLPLADIKGLFAGIGIGLSLRTNGADA